MKTYTVIFQTGGSENFKWNRILTVFTSHDEAISKKLELERMGYPAVIHDTKMLDSLGMPETYYETPFVRKAVQS